MLGFGFGYRSGRRRIRRAGNAVTGTRTINPSASWNGLAGSGFVTAPSDPNRISAKPAIRLITPPNQYFTDSLLVGVIAGANNAGSLLDNMGLEKVIAHYEGSQIAITAPSIETIIDANGTARSYFGWWIRLKKTGNGHANLYFEAVPKDASMQKRVIGPYQFSPQAALHDVEIEVNPGAAAIPGARYTSIAAAISYLVSIQAGNPRITLTQPGFYEIAAGSVTYQGQGYLTISATVPVTIGKSAFTTESNATIRPRWDGLRLSGENITLDALYVSGLYQENVPGRQHWLDGIKVINSGGRYALWRKGPRPLGYLVRNNAWYTECDIAQVSNACVNASLVRGCYLHGGYSDAMTDAACVIDCRTDDWDSSDGWTVDVPSLRVQYSGPEASASLSISGGNDASSRTLTVTWGTNSATFTVGNTEAMQTAGTYTVAQVAAWINGLAPGFSATVIDDSRRASALSLAGLKGAAFAAQDIRSAALTLVTMFDQHTDWFQQNNAGMLENCIIANNTATNLVAQNIFITGTGGAKDFLIFNNAFENKLTAAAYAANSQFFSQLARNHSHVVVTHNTWASQGLWLRGDQAYAPDGYTLIANNAVRDVIWAGTPVAPLAMINNHLQQGATGGTLGTGTTTGGVFEQSFADAATGNFNARGPLEANRKPPVIANDRGGTTRAATDAAGSEAYIAPPAVTPTTPQYGSVQFPSFNRAYDGIAGNIAFPNTGLVQTPLLSPSTPGAFFIMLQVPRERTKQNREYRIFGNAVATTTNTFSLVYHGDNYFDGTRHDEFRWRSRGSTGDLLDISVDCQLRSDSWQLIVVRCDGAANYSVASYSAKSAKIGGTTQTSTTHSLNSLTGTHITLADAANSVGSLAKLAAPTGCFDGAVAFHGFVTGTAGDDAAWQAICEGADIVAALPGATGFRLLRDYRHVHGFNSGLAPFHASDPTQTGILQGTASSGGTPPKFNTAKFISVTRLPDGYVLCPPTGQPTGKVAISGKSGGLNGALFARVVDAAGVELVPGLVAGGVASDFTADLALPPFRGWGYLEFWAESDPSVIFRMNSRIGCGDKLAAIGQSQTDIMLQSGGIQLNPTGRVSVATHMGTVSDPADTLTSPVPRFSTSARAQLYVIEPQMTQMHNGVIAIAERIAPFNNGAAICVIDAAIPGTSARDWINDTTTVRQWQLDVEVAALAGRDRVPAWQWYTAETGYDYTQIFDAVVFGTGPYAGQHTLFDGSLQNSGYKLAISLPSRATTTSDGPFDSDNFGFNRTYAQDGQIAWAGLNPSLAAMGPALTDMAIDNLATGSTSGPSANLGGPHESQVLREGVYRMGYRMGEAYLRARGISPSPGNPYLDRNQVSINAGRTEITAVCVLPNAGTGLRTADGRMPTGFELSVDGGNTWSRSGFTAEIVSNNTVKLTKTTGSWPANLKFTYLRGGPFSYGTAEELNAHYKGSLYDGCECEGGLGFPVLGISTANGLTL